MAPADVTARYRAELIRLRGRMGAISGQLAAEVYDPETPIASLTALAAQDAAWTTAAQARGVETAQAFLAAQTAETWGVPVAEVEPFAEPPGVVGSSAAGLPLAQTTGIAPGLYVVANGTEPGGDPSLALNHLTRVAVSEPLRAANATIVHNAGTDPRLQGRYVRETSPGACKFCELIKARGYVPYAPGITFAAHANCRCTAGPVIAHYSPRRTRRR